MNIGDLVQLESWCKNKGRRGIVVEVPEYLGCVKIRYLDTGDLSSVIKDNLRVLSEGR